MWKGLFRKKSAKTASDLRLHFKKRLKQRYGIEINREGIEYIVRQIQSQNCEFVIKQSLRVTIFDVMYENKKIRVVYDKNRKTLITALKPNWQGKYIYEKDEED